MLQLRDYQTECLRAVIKAAKNGVRRSLVSLPTGSGKTIIFAYLIKQIKGRSLVLVHRDELLTQAEDKLLTIWPDAHVGVVKGERNELDAQVIIASVQTISREKRLAELSDIPFSFLVTDEAHHAVAASYKRIYESVLQDGGKQVHLGVTATPRRADRIGLKEVYQKIVYQKSLLDMIRAGWLCDLRCVQIKTDISLDGVHTRRGDLAAGELASVINTENRNELIVQAYKEHAPGRLALCFTVDVQHAQDLAAAFQEAGINAVALSGKTPLQERRSVLRQFHSREIEVICNCQLLTEGYDEPAIDCILLARPTKSTVLYTQMVGRGCRTFPGKADCLILDVADVAGRHSIVQLPFLVDLKKKHKLDGKETVTEMLDRERGPAVYGEGVGIAASEIDLFSESDFQWIPVDQDRYLLNLGDVGKIEVIPSSTEGKYDIVYQQNWTEKYLSPRPTDLSWALGIAEASAKEITRGDLRLVRKNASWRRYPASEKQKAVLNGHGVDYGSDITKGEASDVINVLFATKG